MAFLNSPWKKQILHHPDHLLKIPSFFYKLRGITSILFQNLFSIKEPLPLGCAFPCMQGTCRIRQLLCFQREDNGREQICLLSKMPFHTFLYQEVPGVLVMSPRHEPKKTPHDPQSHLGSHAGQDKERNDEGDKHHPLDHPLPHPAHHPQAKPALSPRHDAHSHPHGDELPAHTNSPGPLKPSKKMTKTGKA